MPAIWRRRGSTRSPRAGSGTAAPPISSAWSTGSAISNDAIAEAARRAHLDPADVHPVFLEKKPGWLGRLFADAARDDDDEADASVAARDAFAGIARRPEAMIARALNDAQQLLAGPAIQARCLECGSDAPLPPAPAAESLWTRLLSLVWLG